MGRRSLVGRRCNGLEQLDQGFENARLDSLVFNVSMMGILGRPALAIRGPGDERDGVDVERMGIKNLHLSSLYG